MGVVDIVVASPDDFSWDTHLKNIRNSEGIFIEVFHKRKDNTTFPVEISVRSTNYENKEYLIAIARDISERRENEKALKIERDRLNTVLNAMDDGLYIVDQQYNIEYTNSVIEKEFGPINNRKCFEYFHGRTEDCPWCKNKEVFSGKSVHWEWYSIRNNKHYDLFDTPILNQDGSISKFEVFHDITEKKIAQKELKNSKIKIENAHNHAMYMLAVASEYKDPETGNHIKRIVQITTELALEMGIEPDTAKQMGTDSLLHDLGKLGISDYILLKPGKLTSNEFETIKQHTSIGAKIIGDDEWFKQVRQIAFSHHEKWNGSGYPEGLKGKAIPIASRIVAVADVFDALITRRPYKNIWPLKKAIDEIKREAGAHFDPEVVKAFLSLHRKGELKKYLSKALSQ